ncbi:S-adenosyl-L-methionine-dependent tRNA 4-demethylwyosine synthase isoform X4 [Sagmatias obliquidens]|uniref:S-adenosyl-L-methionine-dependent tRNA 4-demethylwyosine synthase isoform X4 n=1 Tax=Sagmatias obliquidens TaxID=3371155 RepID=UPI000F4457E7|nr:S-adenosyl-L-methionine-dependent tRNA 4-demethylwyosine synthase isoform X4 [Lagenorhynchus obliquidens]
MDPSLDMWDFSSLISLWINRFYIYLGFAFGFSLWICFQIVIRKQNKNSQEKTVPKASQDLMTNGYISLQKKEVFVSGVKIFYGSQTGTAKGFATVLAEAVSSLGLPVALINLKEYDPDDHLVEEVTSKNVSAFLVATYTDGRPTESAEWFCRWLEEAANDFRFGKTYLKGVRYAVFGLGNSAYVSHFNKVGKDVDKWLWMLGAHRVMSRGEGDCNVVKSKHGSIEADFTAWKARFISRLQALCKGERKPCGGNCKKGKCESNQHGSEAMEPGSHAQEGFHQRDTEQEEPFGSTSEEESGTEDHQSLKSVIDVEDLGKIMDRMKKEKREKERQEGETSLIRSTVKNEASERRAMITPALREALTKQGYQLIGSHSGVKLCRWTKSMLRGRGGCYKHTFYGIESHRCMETTPSLACANKCVFCWRHHTNPVGTEWRWKMDQPEMILKEAIENHQNVMKQFRGVPGVREERFEEGMTVKHCALSLVGEPIMYPEINRFLKLLHERKISSFLVTNAQFPAEIRNLKPVTQLYVSVDASTKESLKKIDRPLFKDFWQRFLDSLKALAAKGVTYCGESSASSLTMANVPWHEEVVRFVCELVDLIPDYEIACEHEHSNCLLIAHKKFKIGREWWTWIDYSRFQELIQEYEDSGGSRTFSAKDYMARTPHWALFGASERGFDPKDTRYQRKNKSKDISGC